MGRPPLLNDQQRAELREAALQARAASSHRGKGSPAGAFGPDATTVLIAWAHEHFDVAISRRTMQRLLGQLGLVYRAAGQGGHWREAGR